jgi:membrane associated rhomboid family serine protease
MLTEISQAASILLLCIFVPIPYATDRRIRRTPWVTYGIIIANALVFSLFIFPTIGAPSQGRLFSDWGVIPRDPRILNFVTYLFLHVGLAHLLWNTAFLWLFGPSAEDALGHAAYILLYLLGGAVAGMLHMAIVLLFAENSAAAFAPLVGSSGAISAVIGLYALRYYRSKLKMVWGCARFLELSISNFEAPAIVGIGLWLVQNLFGAIISLFQPDGNGISYWAHIGGFLFGMTVAEVTGLLGDGVRESLFDEAVKAGEKGSDGVRIAFTKFQELLQRRPGDGEVRDALAVLAKNASSNLVPDARLVICEAYSLLLERSLIAEDIQQSREWLAAFDEYGSDDIIHKETLLRVAGRAEKSGDLLLAERLYGKVLGRFPGTPEWEYALLDTMTLRLDHYESPGLITETLVGSLSLQCAGEMAKRKIDNRPWWRRTILRLKGDNSRV